MARLGTNLAIKEGEQSITTKLSNLTLFYSGKTFTSICMRRLHDDATSSFVQKPLFYV